MSYAAISSMVIRGPDGGPIATVDVPVEDILDTVGGKIMLAWPAVLQASLTTIDAYAQSSVWPAIRAEADSVIAEAAAETKRQTARIAVGAGIALAALVGGAVLLLRRHP
jgi:hypothetical protein